MYLHSNYQIWNCKSESVLFINKCKMAGDCPVWGINAIGFYRLQVMVQGPAVTKQKQAAPTMAHSYIHTWYLVHEVCILKLSYHVSPINRLSVLLWRPPPTLEFASPMRHKTAVSDRPRPLSLSTPVQNKSSIYNNIPYRSSWQYLSW